MKERAVKRIVLIIREYPNALIFYTAFLHIGWGLMFLFMDNLPLPFAGFQWYAEHGGQPVWGPLFVIVGLMAVAATIARDRDRKLLLILPSFIVVFLGSYGMLFLLITSYSDRLLAGSGYVFPHAICYGLAIALTYGIPHEEYIQTLQRYATHGRTS